MASVRIGGAEAQASFAEVVNEEVTCGFPRTPEAEALIKLAVPGAHALVMLAGEQFEGRVRITDPWDYVTAIEFC